MTPLTERIRAKKSLGQHFLASDHFCARIVALADIGSRDNVVEIGAGAGALTRELLKSAHRVVALEFDRDMVALLRQQWPPEDGARLEIVQANALTLRWSDLPLEPPWKAVGNLPYNIATRLVRQMIETKNRFQSLTFMVQKEVAERLLAQPGDPDYSGYSVLLQSFFETVRGFDVPPGAFNPPPKVVSHVLQLIPRPEADAAMRPALEKLLRAAFAQRRKTLRNNLRVLGLDPDRLGEALRHCGASPEARPQQLSREQFACLTGVL